MDHKVKHALGRPLAKKATEAALKAYAAEYAEYEPRVTWADEHTARVTFNVKGMTLKGEVGVHEHDISLDLDVPFLFRPFKAKALEVIEREIRKWIEKAKNGELG
jgi:hypothetical protein